MGKGRRDGYAIRGEVFYDIHARRARKDSSLMERDVRTVVHSLKLIELYAGGGTS